MCPGCLTTAALFLAGTTSAGGLAALFIKLAETGSRIAGTATPAKGE